MLQCHRDSILSFIPTLVWLPFSTFFFDLCTMIRTAPSIPSAGSNQECACTHDKAFQGALPNQES